MVEHRAEIAHVEIAAAGFALEKVISLVHRLHADALADDGATRESAASCSRF